MSEPLHRFYEFGPFVLDTREKVLLRDGQPVPLKPKGYRVLLALVERSGFIVEKDYFMREVWDGSLRDESNLPQQVSVLRKTLGEAEGTNGGERYIETIATRGYKFVATVRPVESQSGTGKAAKVSAEASADSKQDELTLTAVSAPSMVMERHTAIRVARVADEKQVDSTLPEHPREHLPALSPPGTRTLFSLSRRGKLLMLVIVCSVLAITFLVYRSQRQTRFAQVSQPAMASVPEEIRSIAVLPFRMRGEASGNEYLELGLAESVAMKLGGISSLTVRPMSAVEREVGQLGNDPLATGRALRTDAVLDGSVQRVGDQVRVTAQLLRVSDGKQLWSGSFDEESAQVFRIQDAISEQLVSGLALKLGEGERERLARRHTQNPEAYRLYLLGRYFWRTDAQKSRHYHQQALAADPSYALAHAGLADTYAFGGLSEAHLAEKHAREALRLDDSLAEPHATLGFVQMFSRWQWDDAGKELKRALELNPRYPTAHQWYALYLACSGRTTEAVARMQQAVDLDPLSPAINADLGQMHFFAGDFPRAEAASRRALELKPHYDFALLYLFYIYSKSGRESEAADAFLSFRASLGFPPSQVKDAAESERLREVLREDNDFLVTKSRDPKSYNRLAENYALLGDREQALSWIEKSVESHNFFMAFIKVNPVFENLRGEPRYQALVERVGLAR